LSALHYIAVEQFAPTTIVWVITEWKMARIQNQPDF